jgi:hypothetical protein
MSKPNIDKPPVSGLPGQRKRPHAFGAPSIDEFYASIAKVRRQQAVGKRRP